MAKNIKIVPNPTGSTPYILFTNANGNEIQMRVADDGSLIFSGKTQGDEIVKMDADTLNFTVKGDVDFLNNINFWLELIPIKSTAISILSALTKLIILMSSNS